MHADQIIVLDDDGTIAGMGTHDELLETCETYREIVYSQLGAEERGMSSAASRRRPRGKGTAQRPGAGRRPPRAARPGRRRPRRGARPCAAEKAKDFRGSLRRLVGQLQARARAASSSSLLLAVVSVAFAVLGPKILGNATNILFEGVVSKQLPAGVTQAQAVAGLQRQGPGDSWPTCCRPCTCTRVTASTSAPSGAPCCCSSASTC